MVDVVFQNVRVLYRINKDEDDKCSPTYLFEEMLPQARNQEFFRAWEFSSN